MLIHQKNNLNHDFVLYANFLKIVLKSDVNLSKLLELNSDESFNN